MRGVIVTRLPPPPVVVRRPVVAVGRIKPPANGLTALLLLTLPRSSEQESSIEAQIGAVCLRRFASQPPLLLFNPPGDYNTTDDEPPCLCIRPQSHHSGGPPRRIPVQFTCTASQATPAPR